ncbi:TPA: hypothetical protein ACJTPC_002914 [Providencia alcalifaciens]
MHHQEALSLERQLLLLKLLQQTHLLDQQNHHSKQIHPAWLLANTPNEAADNTRAITVLFIRIPIVYKFFIVYQLNLNRILRQIINTLEQLLHIAAHVTLTNRDRKSVSAS